MTRSTVALLLLLLLLSVASAVPSSADEPKAKAEEPKAKAEEPKAKPEEPKAKPEEPKAKPEEPKAKDAKPAEPEVMGHEYFPVKVGTKWTYKSPEGKFTAAVTKVEKIGEVPCAVIEGSQDGRLIAVEHVAGAADGMYRYAFGGVDPSTPRGATPQKCEPPVPFLKSPAKAGDAWKAETTVAGQKMNVAYKTEFADVEVPAGKYKALAVSVDLEIGGQKAASTIWYAAGVGMVKQVLVLEGQEIKLELEKFEPAGAAK